MLQGNSHIVQIYDIPNNPLESVGGLDRRDWIVMEWIEYGEVGDFINLASQYLEEGERLPSRLLWRIFLCCKSVIALKHVSATHTTSD